MRKLTSLSVAALLALSMVALADSADRTIAGTVSRVDMSAKTISVKDASGTEVTVVWNDTTRLDSGVPQEGSTVTVTVDGKDQNARPTAKSITVQPKKPY
jgi:hypothetical protein